MANQLKKLALIQYTPGSPYVPAMPAHCVTTTESTIGVTYVSATGGTVVDGAGASFGVTPVYEQVIKTTQVCYPATPEQLAVPATTTYTSVNGWNGGGRSIAPMVGDGAFTFELNATTIATVVGLAADDVSTLPNEPTHAFYVHQGVVDIMESGTVVATAPVAHDATKRYAISRAGTTITYSYDGWVYTSAVPATNVPLYLDAAIYASGDSVNNPELTGPQALDGSLVVELPPLVAYLTDADDYAYMIATLPPLEGSVTALTGEVASLVGVLPPITATLADYNYASLVGTLLALTMSAHGGFPEVSLATLVGVLPPLAMWAQGQTGEIATLNGSLPPLGAMLVDREGYGQLKATLPPLRMLMLQLPDDSNARSTLVTGDFYTAHRERTGAIHDSVQVGDSFVLQIVISGDVFDALMMSGSVSGYRAITALIQSGVLLSSGGADNADIQYAVNVLTNALTTYTGMDFKQFALADGSVYGVRQDGVYRLRHGDDNGTPINAYVDFGTSDFGTTDAKTVEAVFLGLDTDGDAVVTLRADGVDRAYRVIPRTPLLRASAARGVTGRQWNLTLDVTNATELRLDTVEQLVAVATRRWVR